MSNSLITREVNPSWFIGKAGNAMFFGTSREAVSAKHKAYVRSKTGANVACIRAARTARKLLAMERQLA